MSFVLSLLLLSFIKFISFLWEICTPMFMLVYIMIECKENKREIELYNFEKFVSLTINLEHLSGLQSVSNLAECLVHLVWNWRITSQVQVQTLLGAICNFFEQIDINIAEFKLVKGMDPRMIQWVRWHNHKENWKWFFLEQTRIVPVIEYLW